MTGRAPVLLQSSQWAVGGNWRKQQVWRGQTTSNHTNGQRERKRECPKQRASPRALSEEFLLLLQEDGGGTAALNAADVFLTNQHSSTHSPTSQDSREWGKAPPQC